MPTRKSTTSALQIDRQWEQLEAHAAKLGLSTEEFLEQRLTDLAEKHPERYAELKETLATGALRVVRLCRQASAKLPHIEAAAQATNDPRVLNAVHDLRRAADALVDECSLAALLRDEGISRA